MLAAGRTNKIQIWSIESKDLLKTITLDDDINTIKDCIILSGFYENKVFYGIKKIKLKFKTNILLF